MKGWERSKGSRIRASDKSLVYHFCIGWLLLLFVAVFLLLNLRQLLVVENGRNVMLFVIARQDLVAVAKSERNDDVLFWDGVDYYIVHLTWGKGNAHFPIYKIIHQNDIIEYLENDYLYG